ncbi:hypothetical protein [Bifidobacterium callitrichos]|uniref:hypothetical protein n=1 Tax=Bifidobacterium callitrichos TaxID=762209 RepID=UPI00126A6256|nr:hypothetical protein [Bifidobacterium callitrichos]
MGDTLFNRYTLVALLRDEPGVQAWKANDRVLAQDCQLFILTAPETLDDISSLASTAGLKDGLTPVLQFRRAGDVAVLVTKLEKGLSLTEYLRGKARGTLSYEAIRSVIGDAATIVSGLEVPRLSTDTIRVSVDGLEIADVPLTALLSEPTGAPDGMPTEQLAIRQLAAVMYGMLKRRPVTLDTEYDLSSLDSDMPTEFHVILSRGLELPNANTGKRGEPMLTLGELTALLGEWTPLAQLSDRDIALPSDAGEGSISTVAVRDLSKAKLAELPAEDVSNERLPELKIHRAPSEQEAARHADAIVAAQNAESFADMEESFKEYSPHDFFAMGRNVSPEERARIAARSYVTPASNGAGGTGANAAGTAGNRAGQANAAGHDVQHRTEDLVNDFSFQVYPAPVSLPDDLNTGEETSRIPIINESNMPTVAIDMRDPENMSIEGFEDFVNPHEADGARIDHASDGDRRGHGGRNGAATAAPNGHSGNGGISGNASVSQHAGTAAGHGSAQAGAAHDLTDHAQGTQGAQGAADGAHGGVTAPHAGPHTAHDASHHGHGASDAAGVAGGSMPPAIPVSPALPPRPVESDFDMNHPPSFKPKSMLDRDPADDAHEDLSDHRLLGNMTTATVLLVVAALVLIALLVGAVYLFNRSSSNPQDPKVQQNEWPSEDNLNDVPFGDSSNDQSGQSGQSSSNSGQSSQSGQSGTAANGADASDIITINVTSAYFR